MNYNNYVYLNINKFQTKKSLYFISQHFTLLCVPLMCQNFNNQNHEFIQKFEGSY